MLTYGTLPCTLTLTHYPSPCTHYPSPCTRCPARCPLHPHPRYTALVKLHRGKGPIEGGDFAFAEEGWVLKVEAGNILIYDPLELHGTTEMHLAGPDDGCIYIAFYVKKAIVGAAAGTMAMPAKAMAMK